MNQEEQWKAKQDRLKAIAMKHNGSCCCSICVKFGLNQKPEGAPSDHAADCLCNKCVGKYW